MPAPFLHCWHADLAAEYPAWGPAEASLSEAERARQARFRTGALRQTYGRAHGFLRAVLGRYLDTAAAAVAFAAGAPRSKPALPLSAGLDFNLSYRAGRALLAVANCCAVGADVETLLPMTDALALVQDLFSGPEQAALRATASGAAWEALFYTIWTRKEAYAKALGMGLSLPFAGFSVLEAEAGRLVAPAGAYLASFAAGPGHQGALAALGAPAGLEPAHFNYPADL
ncbi:4'-phosphopantetheinyl transferase family protein [Hymenobacter caeli]|uniref:4'-phosphopantetheinyl transferase n=1 Tax=Hymenobacter caeli TaxID=2735894 RepID=A0ABX2FTG6_9BACT|nr:4'-phosphopantetheinyl transferase superfamily protein [Hymenobacter caeli]NRT20483.1 4'-phosphopantetheinyl transferase [Hymenobacter caeli]